MSDKSIAVVGLGFGDEGKGQFLNYLSKKLYSKGYRLFEKCCGGCQGKHSVKLENGEIFSFAQLSPGILNENSLNLLGKGFVFEPFALINEVELLSQNTNVERKQYFQRIFVDNLAICVTPFHKLYNIAEEEYEKKRGSVGTGVSIAGLYSDDDEITVYAQDLLNRDILKRKLRNQKKFFVEKAKQFGCSSKYFNLDYEDYISGIQIILNGNAFQIVDTKSLHSENMFSIYESSQGILIDREFGIKPNITYLNVNPTSEIICEDFDKIGVIRGIYTRHGQGVFPTEDNKLKEIFTDENQEIGRFSGELRFGWLDLVLLKYALRITNVDYIYMSCLDYLNNLESIKICNSYLYEGTINSVFNDLFDYEEIEEREIETVGFRKVKIKGIKKNDSVLKYYLDLCKPNYEELNLKDRPLAEKIDIYIGFIENRIGKKIDVISKGNSLSDVVERTL